MNFAKGGPRILMVCVALIWLVCGGISAAIAFADAAPTTLPYTDSLWRGLLLGAGGGAIFAAHVFLQMMTDHAKDNNGEQPGGMDFVASLWGMAAAFIGWIASMYCVVATSGGWEPPLRIMYSTALGSALTTLAIIGIIWLIPIGLLVFVAWIWDGFASDH